MEILSLIFSTAGAAIVACLTILIILVLFLLFTEKFRGLTASYKNIKVRIPDSKQDKKATPLEVIENLPAKISPPTQSVESNEISNNDQPPILKLFDAVEARDKRAIERAIEELRPNPPFGLSSAELDVFGFYQLVRAGFADAIQKLKDIENSNNSSPQASRYLAEHYIDARSFDKANLHISAAKERAKTDKQKASVALLEAKALQLVKDKLSAAELLERSATEIAEPQEQFRLYDEASKLFKDSSNAPRAIAALERAVACSPESIDARFRLAMMYGEINALKPLALRHYNIILRQEPNNVGALNNVGIIYGELGLPIQKVIEIRRAAEQEDSHAIGNLASMMIDEGFTLEAEQLLEKVKQPDSERVLYARQRLQILVSTNEKKKEELDAGSEELAKSLSDFKFNFPLDIKKYYGKWEGNKNQTLEIEQVGSYEKITLFDNKQKFFSYSFYIGSIARIEFSAKDEMPRSLLFMVADKALELTFLFGENEIRAVSINENKPFSIERFARPS